MRVHINHKPLLKIQNRGKEGAFPRFLIFFRTSSFCLNIDELSSQVLQNRRNPRWLSTNTIAIAMQLRGTITIQLADFVDRDWFSMVLCGRNFCSSSRIRRQRDKCLSKLFHGIVWKQNFPHKFWPYFHHYRDNTFVDRETKCRK